MEPESQIELSHKACKKRVQELEKELETLRREYASIEHIKKSYETFRVILDGLESVVYVTDAQSYELLFVNRYGKQVLGLPENPEGNICWKTMQLNQVGPCPFCNIKSLLEKNDPSYTQRWEFINTINGRWYNIQDRIVQWIDGRLARLEIATDFTERIEAEQKLEIRSRQLESVNKNLEKIVHEEIEKGKLKEQMLIQQSKLAAMGEMIGAIAHQWRQPLNAVGLLIQDIEDAYTFGQLDKKYLEEIIKSAMSRIDFMSRTIDDFRSFFKPSKEKVAFEIAPLISETLFIMEGQLYNHNIEIRKHFQTNSAIFVEGYPNEFKQAILNILSNADDAILEMVEQNSNTKFWIDISNDIDENSVNIRISNNGGEIPEQHISRIFEPYFTTKEKGKGTGIGLYMTKVIIENNMGGSVDIQNIPGGIRCTISLKRSI